MDKKQELKTTKAIVNNLLKNEPATRNSDNYLYLQVISELAGEKKIDLHNVSILDFLHNMSEWGFPPFESVRRSRQTLQHDNPELSSNEEVQAFRTENEAVFRGFARGEL